MHYNDVYQRNQLNLLPRILGSAQLAAMYINQRGYETRNIFDFSFLRRAFVEDLWMIYPLPCHFYIST